MKKISGKVIVYLGAVIILIIAVISFIIGLTSQKLVTGNGFAMSTFIDQQVYSRNISAGNRVISNAMSELKAFEDRLSMYVEGSEVSRINDNAGIGYVTVSEHTFALISKAKRYCEASGGVFDITIAPVTKAWGINSDSPRVPPQSELDELKTLINYKDILLDDKTRSIMLRLKGQAIDLGAIAKGEACNQVRDIYQKSGISAGLLSIGGNIMVMGEKSKKNDFVIGIRDPRGTQNDYIGTVKLTDTVLSTSGDYERVFEQNGIYYHHIMDPKTAKPAETDLMSVTIICKDGAYADFLSTYLFMLGSKEVLTRINSLNAGIIAIDKDFNVYLSDSVKPEFTPADNSAYTFHLN